MFDELIGLVDSICLQNHDSVLIDGECQIPDPLYKFIGSIICFYIPLIVMLLTYALTVRLLAEQRQNLGTPDWSSGWMGGPTTTALGKSKINDQKEPETNYIEEIVILCI